MDIHSELDKARQLNENDNPRAALKILKSLYRADPTNQEVLLQVTVAFELLEQWENARGMLAKILKLTPDDYELWIRLSRIYEIEENLATALRAIDKGLSYSKNELSLLMHKAHLLGQMDRREEMHHLVDSTIDLYPEHRTELLEERATIYESIAYQAREDEAQIRDLVGMSYSLDALQKSAADLTDALQDAANNHQILIKRARVFKLLQQYDDAIADFDTVLNSADENIDPFRDFLQEERDKCLDGGRSERSQLAETLRQGQTTVDDQAGLSQDELMANNLLAAMADQLASGEDMASLVDQLDDPDQIVALNIAQNIVQTAREPSADFTRVNKFGYDKSAQKFCDLAEDVFYRYKFSSLGDYEPKTLSQQLGKRILVRIFSSQDQLTNAGAFQIKAAKPSFLAWLLLVIQRKWKTANVVELCSETVDGRFILTNNAADLNSFAGGDAIDMLNLATNTPISEIIAAHNKRLQEYSADEIKKTENIGEILSMHERLRLSKNAYRESIGFVTDDELKKLLGKQYKKYATDIRKYLEKLTETSSPEFQPGEA